jgi:hypothetical protein
VPLQRRTVAEVPAALLGFSPDGMEDRGRPILFLPVGAGAESSRPDFKQRRCRAATPCFWSLREGRKAPGRDPKSCLRDLKGLGERSE